MDCSGILVRPSDTLRHVMERIDRAASGIALVVDDQGRLLSTVTDGDVRRAILHGFRLDVTLAEWSEQQPEQGNRRPTTASVGTPVPELLRIMEREGINHLPLVDQSGRVTELARRADFVADTSGVTALLMAGGEGKRLRPLTGDTPKPMLKVGDRPLIEHTVERLRDAGITRVSIATHYLASHIMEHFGNGGRFGVAIDYVNEDRPLGTAGALSMAEPWESTLLVMNGDIHTHLDPRMMLSFHREAGATMTVAVRQYDMQVPYGVVETEGVKIRALREKPTIELFVNAGVYLLEPGVRRFLTSGEVLDMTTLIDRLLAGGERVVSFPISEYWIDIGRHDDYAQAQADLRADGAAS
ncbi:MAG TPA: nucleotidyltransferase family protein [Vicinamibacterales bacterium]|nr:nucleotidyltransferase family protein [Vicinamibacterales bacterium]